MATFCCCGNETSKLPEFKMTVSPCQCDVPQGRRRTLTVGGKIPEFCFERQYEQRTRLNLPLETDTEKGIRKRWV